MITPFPQGFILHSIVLEHELSMTLEIGLAYGGSALFICDAHRRKGAGHHFAVDPFQMQSFHGEGLNYIRKAGLGSCFQWLPTTAQVALPALRNAGVSFDLIYIDGNHDAVEVLSDFLRANVLLKIGGYLAFDDSHFPSGVRVLRMVVRHFPYQAIPDRSTDRLTILRKTDHSEGPAALRLLTGLDRGFLSESRLARRLKEWSLNNLGR
jgi:cephalosporin hydroxylase